MPTAHSLKLSREYFLAVLENQIQGRLGMAGRYAFYATTCKMKQGGYQEFKVILGSHSKFEASLDYMKPCLRKCKQEQNKKTIIAYLIIQFCKMKSRFSYTKVVYRDLMEEWQCV